MIEERDEEFKKDVEVRDNQISLELKPFEVVTLRLKLK